MKKYMSFIVAMLMVSFALADTRPILLVTPKGVYQAEVVDGVPGPWKATNLDVIVQGFSTGGPVSTPPTGPPIVLPPSNPTVIEVARLSKTLLGNKMDAIAVASLITSLQKTNITPATFIEAMEMAIPIADSSLKAEGRLVKWYEAVVKVTKDATIMKAGLQQAFAIDNDILSHITASALDKDVPIPEQALDMAEIIKLIQLIMDLLRNLGVF